MINIQFLSTYFSNHIKNGLYVDYFLKLNLRTFLLNTFIWGSVYVSEKLLIEFTTRFSLNQFTLGTPAISLLNVFTASLKYVLFLLIIII